ncbi:NEAT domain-containing protein [Erysipelotrichaceae bacterium HCN-30851]
MNYKTLNLLLAGALCMPMTSISASSVKAQSTDIDISTYATVQQPTVKATYTVPVVSLESKAPIQAIQDAFQTAFGERVTIIEYSDGSLKATVRNQHMIIENLFGSTYEANIKTLAYYLADGTTQDAVINSTRDSRYSENFGKPDSFINVTVPDEITFPLIDGSGTYKLQATIDFMDAFMGNGNAYPTDITLNLDLSQKVEVVDKTELNSKITEAQTYLTKDYTTESLNALKAKIEEAKALYNNDQAIQSDIDAMVEALSLSISGLKENAKTIADGDYMVEAKILKKDSTTETSMANLALKGASLKVENGTITVFLNMQDMEMYGMKATVDAISYQDLDGTWKDAKITLTENNIPTQFSFVLPSNVNYTNVKFFYMGNSGSEARLYLNLDGLVTTSVNKVDLKAAIEKASAYNKEDYTSKSFTVLETALAKAQSVLYSENVTQDEVDQQVQLLNQAISQLVKKATSGITLLEEDGIYQVPVYLWNATADKASMASGALKANAIIKVENGKKIMTIYTKKMTMGTITAYLQELKLVNSDKTYTDVFPSSTDSEGNPTSFTFELPHTNEYIDVLVNPHVALMGNQDIPARIKVDYSQLSVYVEDTAADNTSSQTEEKQETSSENTVNKINESVQTSYQTNVALMGGLLAASLLLVVYVNRRRKCE